MSSRSIVSRFKDYSQSTDTLRFGPDRVCGPGLYFVGLKPHEGHPCHAVIMQLVDQEASVKGDSLSGEGRKAGFRCVCKANSNANEERTLSFLDN